ncbi:hypothetical protein P3W53_06980 [Pseudomonas denitrificans (nom. rej.)]|nr:hypothetical protein [Pseudomonas denitrificans (nom. rej.)]
MTLADERRAIGNGITAARQSQQLVSDLQSLESQRRKIGALNELERRGARPATPGRAVYKPQAASSGGIASPLQESNFTDRTYHPEIEIKSTDGLLSWKVKPIHEVYMRDANNAEVKMIYAQPPAETP